MKPILYMDVDGPFFGTYDGALQLKPGANSFLRWSVEHFDCRWLTVWEASEIADWLAATYAFMRTRGLPHIKWKHLGDKVDAINLQEDFYWFEDGIGTRAEKILEKVGKLDRYIEVDFYDRDSLYKIREELERKIYENNKRR